MFLYGTLADPAALGRCAGRPLWLDPIAATLSGYRRVLLRHARYPTLRRAAGHQVSGIVVRITADMLVRLQAYESFRYRQVMLRLHTAGGPVRARCFMGDAATRVPWHASPHKKIMALRSRAF